MPSGKSGVRRGGMVTGFRRFGSRCIRCGIRKHATARLTSVFPLSHFQFCCPHTHASTAKTYQLSQSCGGRLLHRVECHMHGISAYVFRGVLEIWRQQAFRLPTMAQDLGSHFAQYRQHRSLRDGHKRWKKDNEIPLPFCFLTTHLLYVNEWFRHNGFLIRWMTISHIVPYRLVEWLWLPVIVTPC
jgi:hypothetical protein